MMKPGMSSYEQFRQMFEKFSKEAGKEQYLIPYFIAAHPGTTDQDMLNLALWLKRNNFRLDQVQTFLPTPMAIATAMYHSRKNPLQKVGRDSAASKPCAAAASAACTRLSCATTIRPTGRCEADGARRPDRKPETASRVRGRIEAILAWATVRKYRTGDNPAQWKNHLDQVLPPTSKIAKVKNHPALPFVQIGEFIAALRQQAGIASRALEFAILTATRTNETIGATWQEFDLADAVWIIPAERMKAEKEHRVPLSGRALDLVREMLPLKAGEDKPVFLAPKDKPLSNMAMLAVLKRMKHTDITVHGFRSTFRDWAGELSSFPKEVIEHAMSHQLKDKAEAAYARGTLFTKRRKLMDSWAAYCNTVKKAEGANVVRIDKGKAA
jgi:integrase